MKIKHLGIVTALALGILSCFAIYTLNSPLVVYSIMLILITTNLYYLAKFIYKYSNEITERYTQLSSLKDKRFSDTVESSFDLMKE